MTDAAFTDGENSKAAIKDALLNIATAPSAIPQLIKPSVGVYFNRNMFSGRDIVPQHFQDIAPEKQYTEQTSELSKALGETFGLSPMKLDYWLRGTFSSLAGLAMWTTDRALELSGEKRPSPSAQTAIKQIPGMSRFVLKEQGSGYVDMYYELMKKSDEVKATFDRLKKVDFRNAVKYLDEEEGSFRKLYGANKSLGEVRKALAEIRAAKTQIFNLPADMMSQEEKEEKLAALNETAARMVRSVDPKRLREITGFSD